MAGCFLYITHCQDRYYHKCQKHLIRESSNERINSKTLAAVLRHSRLLDDGNCAGNPLAQQEPGPPDLSS